MSNCVTLGKTSRFRADLCKTGKMQEIKGGMMRLSNKIAIVTGAGSGFGEGIARTFAREGASGIVKDLDEEKGGRVADTIAATREGSALFFGADVTDEAAVAAMVRAAGEHFGGL